MAKRRSALRDTPPTKCITCGKPTQRADGFCADRCKDAAQARVWGVPMRDLPIVRRLPRRVPEGR